MLKSAVIFKMTDFVMPSLDRFEQALGKSKFLPCGATQELSSGWAAPRRQDYARLFESVGGQIILALETEKKSVPGAVLKEELKKRCDKIEAETGRKPGKKEKSELKDEIKQDLLPRAFSKKSVQLAWLDPERGMLVVNASSYKSTDGFITRFVELLAEAGNTVTISALNTKRSPSITMNSWLLEGQATGDFHLGEDVELKQTADKSTVKYTKHNLDLKEIVDHIRHGKMATKLSVSYGDEMSFVLTDSGVLTKLTFAAPAEDAGEDAFDASVAIATGSLGNVIDALIEELGGLMCL